MSLSQVQIIRSLAEALAWFEKELAWGVEPSELRHLTGRIGELYAAMITRGQMALATNQRGYDVVSEQGERISVKTFTSSSHLSFRKSTWSLVHRVIILKINVDEGEASIEEFADLPAEAFLAECQELATEYRYSVRRPSRPSRPLDEFSITAQATYGPHEITQFENGTIVVDTDGVRQPVTKPILRPIANDLGISILNGSGNKKNTRSLGADIIASLQG